VRTRLRSLEQLMLLPTAGELVAQKPRPLVSVPPGTAARDALRTMEANDIAFLPVLEREKLVGVVSERDIARGVILHDRDTVRDIMTTRVQTVFPETKVPDCMMLMHANRIRHLPVTSSGTVLGVLSVRDLMASLLERHARLLRRLNDERVTIFFPYSSSY
jgi:CBS domain-containing protein